MKKTTLDLSQVLRQKGCNCAIIFACIVSSYDQEFLKNFEKQMLDITTHARNCSYRTLTESDCYVAREIFRKSHLII
jgi:hypothetical protein